MPLVKSFESSVGPFVRLAPRARLMNSAAPCLRIRFKLAQMIYNDTARCYLHCDLYCLYCKLLNVNFCTILFN